MESKRHPELFDEAARERLGLRRVSEHMAQEDLAEGMKRVRTRACKAFNDFRQSGLTLREPPEIIFDYVDDSRLGACAFRHNSHGIIAVNLGTLILIQDLFLRFMSHPNVLPEIGDATQEIVAHQVFPVYDDAKQLIAQLAAQDLTLASFHPHDKERFGLAGLLINISENFLIAHEYRHIQAGHVDYRPKKPLQELVGLADSDSEGLMLQALEMDADMYASKQVLRSIIRAAERPNEREESLLPAQRDAKAAVFNALFAIYSLFRVFGTGDVNRDKWNRLTHPPLRVRQTLVGAAVFEALSDWNRDDLHSTVADAFKNVVAECEGAFERITGEGCRLDSLREAMSAEGAEHVDRIMTSWREMEEELSKHSSVAFDVTDPL